ncbi:nonsense-mediated mRNA decay protein 1 [Ophiocordyceps camponoti-floridani]|uniref:Nonsense-mediated mRNA decay protein 1 n=1 Tax=Ophiocordyceps camponoti-floridani TaxID=2030778 RepID=A0A8H4VBK5_9HYPO|nr:nonsense-mediated mRNA decay protein 1 [Ophiocordyceps camponoti-floridani]
MLRPQLTFPDQAEYVWRHEQGTSIEMENESKVVDRLNKKKLPFHAWPIAPIPGLTTSFSKSWLFLVKLPTGEAADAFPSLADRFSIDMEAKVYRPQGVFSLVRLAASRIPNPYENLDDKGPVQKKAAFKVDVPRSWQTALGVTVELDLMATFQTASSISDSAHIRVDASNQQTIFIEYDTNSLTFDAELAALHRLTREHRLAELCPSKLSLDAFRMIRDFNHCGIIRYRDLHYEFPQLRDPAHPRSRMPKLLVDKVQAFNEDHRAALEGLKEIPNSVFFVNGCPGAGKTEWNMVLAALIHAKKSPNARRRNTPILFLVDINKTVDDAANRYYRLCRDAGLKLRIIRMHSWPYEIRHSTKLTRATGEEDAEPDFTRKFLTTASLIQNANGGAANSNEAPSLDEEAWHYYERHKAGCFEGLCRLLARMDTGQVLTSEDWKTLRRLVATLYRAVLAQTDFVATTPVAAYGHFSKLFAPDIIFMDEAPHARELTTLIPIAFYSPLAWIFSGDVNQTQPFVKSDNKRSAEREGLKFNPFAEQLRMSIMARAAAVDAIKNKLLVNKRSFANLHLLPSRLFYDSQMRSEYDETSLYPTSTLYLKNYLERLGGVRDMKENRLVVRLRGGEERKLRESFWNPVHHKWVMEQVQLLLQDESFVTVTGEGAGTIMIATPYSTSVRQYAASVKNWPQEWQNRVEVLTVDKAQGNQADAVFLDLVRTTKAGFMDEAKRLNVAISRARQAEVIVMHPSMTTKWGARQGRTIRSQYLSEVWAEALVQGRLATLGEGAGGGN